MENMKKSLRIIFVAVLCLLSYFAGTWVTRSLYSTSSVNGKIENLKSVIGEEFLFDYDDNKLNDGIYKGLFSALDDPYSEYMTADEYNALEETMSGEFEGIGVVISAGEEFIQVVSPIDDTPAQRAGIQTGDYILKIDGKSYGGKEITSASKAMRGKKGTKVNIVIRRMIGDEAKDMEISLVRDIIPVHTVAYEMIGEYAYVRITSFDEPTPKEFYQAMEEIKKNNPKGMILDLRSNPGGLVTAGVEIADYLLPEGPVVSQVKKNGEKTVLESDKNYYDIPMVVLVDGGTASSSEILTGALRDYKRATIVGTKTFGKGIVQKFWKLQDGSGGGIKITVAEFFTPKGGKIHQEGITPDVIVEFPAEKNVDLNDHNKDLQLQKALEILKK